MKHHPKYYLQNTKYYLKYAHYLGKLLLWKLKHGRRPTALKTSPNILGIGLVTLIVLALLGLVFWLQDRPEQDNPLALKKAPANSLFLYAAESKELAIFIGSKDTLAPTVTLKTKDTSLVSFTLTNLNQNLTKPIRKNNKVTFNDVRYDMDLNYQTLPNGVKEEVILKAPMVGNSLSFTMQIHGSEPKAILNEFYAPVFYDNAGNYLFHFTPPFAYDSAGNRTDNVVIQVQKWEADNEFVAVVTVDESWLKSPERVYPIVIDPTVVHDTSSEFADGTFNRNEDTGAGALPSIETYYQELPADEHTVGLWHMDEVTDDSCSGGEDACDSSGRGYHGTANGTTIINSGQKLGAAARNFSSAIINEYIATNLDADADSLFADASSAWTVEAWFKHAGGASNEMIVGRAGGTGTSATFGIYVDGTDLRTVIRGTQSSIQATGADGEWHHVAVTWDGVTALGYFDGGPPVTLGVGTASVQSLTVAIGSRSGSSSQNSYNGDIDEVRISNTPRAPEEIKASASRHPYSIYTSPVIDLGDNVVSWNSLSWTELGVATSDGETVYDDTDLIAQWKFNETTGTTADNAEGTVAYDGTVTSMTTTGQDDAAGDGWTANNRRWGAGALMFDGTDGYVDIGDISGAGTIKSVEFWINTEIVATNNIIDIDGTDYIQIDANGELSAVSFPGTIIYYVNGVQDEQTITPGEWHHVVVTDTTGVSGTGFDIGRVTTAYYKGVLDAVSIYSDVLTASEVLSNYNAANIELQTRVGADTSPDDGSWDAWAPVTSETQIEDFEGSTTWSYEREIEATNSTSELTNYQVLVEVDTATIISAGKMNSDCSDVRFSSDGTTAIDFWLESGCDTSTTYFWVEVPTIPASSSTNIYLHYGAAEANSVSSIEDTFIADSISHFTGACPTGDANCNQTDNHTEADDVRLNKTVSSTSTVTTINDGTGADNFFRRYRFLFVADTTGTHNFGVNSDDGSEAALFPQDGYGGGYNTAHPYGAHTVVGFWYGGHGSGTCGTSGTPGSSSLTAGQGYWIDYLMTEAAGGQLAQMCINEGSGYLTVSTANFPSQVFGRQYTSGAEPSVGSLGSEAGSSYSESIDFFSIDSTASISQSSESVIKVEGTGSQKLELGQPQADASTVALWHLDETNGNNAEDDVFDATANNNDGEFNGTNIATAVVDGVSGKARNFNGSDDFIDVGTSSTLEPTSALTVEAWVKRDAALADFDAIFSSRKNAAGEAGNFTRGYLLTGISGDNVRMYIWDGAWQSVTSDNALAANQWYHVAGTWDGSTIRLYINGVQQSTTDTTGAIAYPDAPAENHYIGKYNDGGTSDEWKGMIDEVRISDVARSAEEIAEAYRMGKDHYISKTISSTDLSAKKSLPFYIAADRPGTYLEATIGEGSYENYLSDSNTVGFWSFEEIAEDSCNGNSDDVCDRSGSGYNGDETGSSIPGVSGARGLGRKMAEADHLDFGTPDVIPVGTKTIDFWIMPTGSTGGGQYHVLANGSGTTEYGTRVSLDNTNFNVVVDNYKNASGDTNFTITSTTQLPLNKWSHVAFSWDNTTTSGAVKIYINGKLDVTGTADATESNAGTDNFRIGNDETIRGIVGSIDEVRISNAVRSAQEIRTAYETTKRTHPITIDFAASLDSGNLIADSADLSFTVDATSYGLENMGSMLFMGDKIIVRETVDDTQYIAQGTITAVTESTGAVTVSAWDSGGTFPSSGFTTNASVFKWQREYFDISNLTLDSFMDGITNLTFRVTNGNEGRTVWLDDLKSAGDYLTTPGGSTITSSTGNQYFQYRAIMTSLDEAVSATLSAVTLDYETNTAPNTPTLDSPADTAIDQSLLTVLKTTATDDDSDYLRYKIELCTNEAMDAGCQTFDQTVSQTGWSGQDAETSTAYASGTQATYTIQTALDPATTYYWRSYAIDPGGTNTFGSTQGTPYSFTTESTPDPPTACYLNKATDNSSITVHWTDNSSNEDYFYLQRNVNSGGFSDLATTIAADSTSYQDSAVSDGNTYQYRVRSYIDGPSYSDYCTTTTVSLDSDYFNFEAVDIEYVEIN